MTKSRMAILPVLLAAAVPVQGQSVTAEEAMEVYKQKVGTAATDRRCDAATEEDEIVVCGSRGSGQRVAFEPVAGEREIGHVASGLEAMNTADRCVSRCPQPLSINVFKAVPAIAKGIGRLFGGE